MQRPAAGGEKEERNRIGAGEDALIGRDKRHHLISGKPRQFRNRDEAKAARLELVNQTRECLNRRRPIASRIVKQNHLATSLGIPRHLLDLPQIVWKVKHSTAAFRRSMVKWFFLERL